MARLAIFIDGAYLDMMARHEFNGVSVDLEKFVSAVHDAVAAATPEPVDVLRTFYYNCPPYQGNPPTQDERERYAAFRGYANALKSLKRFEFREGRLALRGFDSRDGKPIFQQKRVDLLLGIDFALLCGKRQITHAALVAGDSDLIPAVQAGKLEGVSVWLFHGPRKSRGDGRPTYHQDLWQEADERLELDQAFMDRCARV